MLNSNVYIKRSLIYIYIYAIQFSNKSKWTKRNKIFVFLKYLHYLMKIQDSTLVILKNDRLKENVIAKFSYIFYFKILSYYKCEK